MQHIRVQNKENVEWRKLVVREVSHEVNTLSEVTERHPDCESLTGTLKNAFLLCPRFSSEVSKEGMKGHNNVYVGLYQVEGD
jgi:hypothetical protein